MDQDLSTTDWFSLSPQDLTNYKEYCKAKSQKRKLALGRRLLYNNVHTEGLNVFPRETMENIINRIDNVSLVCLALVDKRHHDLVTDITKTKLNALVPRAPTGYLYLRRRQHGDDTRPYRPSTFHQLLRRLVVWMPERDMFFNLTNRACFQTWHSGDKEVRVIKRQARTWQRCVREDIEWAQGEIERAVERIDTRRGQRSLKVEVEVKEKKVRHAVAQDLTVMPQALEASVLHHENTEEGVTYPSVREPSPDSIGLAQWLHRMKSPGFLTDDNAHIFDAILKETRKSIWHG